MTKKKKKEITIKEELAKQEKKDKKEREKKNVPKSEMKIVEGDGWEYNITTGFFKNKSFKMLKIEYNKTTILIGSLDKLKIKLKENEFKVIK